MIDFKFWDGETLQNPLGLDSETTVVELDREVPKIVLATASDGTDHYVVRREDLGRFLLLHRGHDFVGHNVSFDFWVMQKWLDPPYQRIVSGMIDQDGEAALRQARRVLWDAADQGRLHDTMLLDQLHRLARGFGQKGGIQRRGLDKVAAEHAPHCPQPDKESPYRENFHTLLGACWSFVDPGYFQYAVLDAYATVEAYKSLRGAAEALAARHLPEPGAERYSVYPDARGRYGLLTERLQVQASIALRDVTLRGIAVDREYAAATEAGLRQDIQADWDYLYAEHPDLFKMDRKGGMVLTKKGKTPSLDNAALKAKLAAEAGRLGLPALLSPGKTGGVSTSAKLWSSYVPGAEARFYPFLGAWVRTCTSKSLLKFYPVFAKCDAGGRVHPRYETLKNTGRTGATNPAIQQTPKVQKFRSNYVAADGFLLLTVDYAAVELRTLAAVCHSMFGYSALGDVIKSGRDPHCHTYAEMFGEPYEHVEAMVALEKKRKKAGDPGPFEYTEKRQKMKAVAFGCPGGLGADKLVVYARDNYGVTLTRDEAAEMRHKLINHVYPELNAEDGYLASTYLADLAANLNVDASLVASYLRQEFRSRDPNRALYLMGRCSQNCAARKDGSPYEPDLVARCWGAIRHLAKVARREDVVWAADHRDSLGPKDFKDLYVKLFGHMACTLTGRLRAGTGYTDGKNTPFQSLAADGIKAAMWELCKRGKRVVAMIHDELLVEVPEARAQEEAKEVEHVMVNEMEKVLNGLVPVAAEYVVDRCWRK